MRKGERVETLTKTVGQTPRAGTVIALKDEEFVEVEWDDGHTSIVTRSSLITTSKTKPSEKEPG